MYSGKLDYPTVTLASTFCGTQVCIDVISYYLFCSHYVTDFTGS